MERRIFPEGNDPKGMPFESYRWTRLKNASPHDMYVRMADNREGWTLLNLVYAAGRATRRDGESGEEISDAVGTLDSLVVPEVWCLYRSREAFPAELWNLEITG